MRVHDTDILVVGSGAGASGLLPVLARTNRKITVVERARIDRDFGHSVEERGKSIYQPEGRLPSSTEGIVFYYHHGLGGTTEIACANAVPPSATDCSDLGIDIGDEVDEVMETLGVSRFPDSHLGRNARLMTSAAEEAGYPMRPMPKFIDFSRCTMCATCELLCPNGAKWSSRALLESLADQKRIDILDGITIDRIEMDNATARAAIGTSSEGDVRIAARCIILAPGAVATPVILQNSGFEAGSNFFLDLFVTVYGTSERFAGGREVPMSAFYQAPDESFVVSPYLDLEIWYFLYERDAVKWLPGGNLDGLMVKIKDESSGRVNRDGSVNKKYTEGDKRIMHTGINVAKKILLKCGAAEASITVTSPRGAHPGGTAAIGTVVDNNLRVLGSDNLFVADASVLPKSPGKPPIVTIMALARKLGKSFL